MNDRSQVGAEASKMVRAGARHGIVRCMIGVLFVALFYGSVSHGEGTHTGSIVGRLFDAESGEALLGASVLLEGTKLGTGTDLNGNYIIRNVPVGHYTLIASMVGYRSTKVTEVEVTSDHPAKVELALKPAVLETQNVVVEARTVHNSEAMMLKDRQNAAAVSDAISTEAISRSGSSSAAQAMIRVTGASVVDGKYTVVRGLADRYSNTTLNGSLLPSADPDKPAVQMDLIPTSMLDNIVVNKSFTADKPGNFSGGNVDLRTKDFPESRTLTFSVGSSFNSLTSGKDILTSRQSSTDWLGHDNGMRDLPQFLQDTTFLRYFWQFYRTTNADSAHMIDNAFKSIRTDGAVPRLSRAPLNQSYTISYGDNLSFLGRSLGVVSNISYNRRHSFYGNGERSLWVAASDRSLYNKYIFSDSRGTDEVLIGGLGSLTYSPAPNHILSATYAYNRNSELASQVLVGNYLEYGDGAKVFQSDNVTYTMRTLSSLQFKGRHELQLGRAIKTGWQFSSSRTEQNQPETWQLLSLYDTLTYDSSFHKFNFSAFGAGNTRVFWRDIKENNRDFELNTEVPLASTSKLKLGVSYDRKSRGNRETGFNFEGDMAQLQAASGDWNRFTAMPRIDSVRVAHKDQHGNDSSYYRYSASEVLVRYFPLTQNEYDGVQRVLAGYAMIEAPIVRHLRLVAGLRTEKTEMEISSYGIQATLSRLRNTDWLPSLNLVYALRPTANVRLAYGQTLARPTLRELSPAYTTDFAGDKPFTGNPALKATSIRNFDLRCEWFPRANEILAVSAFYKKFTNPIEMSYTEVGNSSLSMVNAPTANNLGVEVEIRKQLDQVSRHLTNFNVSGNLTLVRSRVKIPADELSAIRLVDPKTVDTRPMANQSPFIINVGAGYMNERAGTAVDLLYNVFGRRFYAHSLAGAPNVYEKARNSLDLTVSQKLFSSVNVKATAKNLLNSRFEAVYYYTGSKTEAATYRSYDIGRSLTVSVNYAVF